MSLSPGVRRSVQRRRCCVLRMHRMVLDKTNLDSTITAEEVVRSHNYLYDPFRSCIGIPRTRRRSRAASAAATSQPRNSLERASPNTFQMRHAAVQRDFNCIAQANYDGNATA